MFAQLGDLHSSAPVVKWFVIAVGLHTAAEVDSFLLGGLVSASLIGMGLAEEGIELSIVGCASVGVVRLVKHLIES